jgi:hypothetical protein
MGRIVVTEFVSLDGVMEAPGGGLGLAAVVAGLARGLRGLGRPPRHA